VRLLQEGQVQRRLASCTSLRPPRVLQLGCMQPLESAIKPTAVKVLCYYAHVFNCNWTYARNLRCHLGQLACCSGGSPLRCLILVTSTIHNQLSNEADNISHRHQDSALVSVAEIKLGGKYSFSTPTCCSIESGCMTKQDAWVR